MDSNEMIFFEKCIFVTFFILSVLVVVYTFWDAKRKRKLLGEKGVKTKGVITRYVHNRDSLSNFHYKFVIADGKEYCGLFPLDKTRLQICEEKYPSGSEIEILYLPEKPKINKPVVLL